LHQIKRTPADHPDLPDLNAALTQISEFTNAMNEQIRANGIFFAHWKRD
jgi:hypothetical protein